MVEPHDEFTGQLSYLKDLATPQKLPAWLPADPAAYWEAVFGHFGTGTHRPPTRTQIAKRMHVAEKTVDRYHDEDPDLCPKPKELRRLMVLPWEAHPELVEKYLPSGALIVQEVDEPSSTGWVENLHELTEMIQQRLTTASDVLDQCARLKVTPFGVVLGYDGKLHDVVVDRLGSLHVLESIEKLALAAGAALSMRVTLDVLSDGRADNVIAWCRIFSHALKVVNF